jgi:hypothetical protein
VVAALAAVEAVAAINLCLDALINGDCGGGGLWRTHRTHYQLLLDRGKDFCFNDKAPQPP